MRGMNLGNITRQFVANFLDWIWTFLKMPVSFQIWLVDFFTFGNTWGFQGLWKNIARLLHIEITNIANVCITQLPKICSPFKIWGPNVDADVPNVDDSYMQQTCHIFAEFLWSAGVLLFCLQFFLVPIFENLYHHCFPQKVMTASLPMWYQC